MVGIVFYQKENKRRERRWGSVREHAGISSPWGVLQESSPGGTSPPPEETNAPANSVVTKGSSELVSPMRSSI